MQNRDKGKGDGHPEPLLNAPARAMRTRERGPKGISRIRTNNVAETEVLAQLEAEGYTVVKRGWPDFLAVRGDEVRLIEVKPTKSARLSKPQRYVAQQLAKLGVTVELAAGGLPAAP